MIAGQTCATCLYFKLTDREGVDGECHRRAPLPMLRSDLYDGKATMGCFDVFWPVVSPREWCGEWGPLAVQQKPEK